MTGNVKVTMKKKMGICIWVGCMILIVAALCLCLMAVGLPYLLLAIAAGKCAGSLYYFLHGIGRQ